MAHANGFVAFLDGLGAPVERGLEAAKLPVETNGTQTIVKVDSVWGFAADMARREGIEDLGVHVGLFIRDRRLEGTLRDMALSAPTLLEGLRMFCRHGRAEGSHLAFGLAERGGSVHFWHDQAIPGHRGTAQMGPYIIQSLLGFVRAFLGPDWQPLSIGLTSWPPPPTLEESYPQTRFLGGQRRRFIEIPRALLFRPPRPRVVAEGGVGPAPSPIPSEFAESLRRLLESYVCDRKLSVDFAAELAGVSNRTLQRRLRESGVSFSGLLGQARHRIAARMLEDPAHTVTDIAHLVGYDDASHFTRAFRRLAGVTPTEFRRQGTPEPYAGPPFSAPGARNREVYSA